MLWCLFSTVLGAQSDSVGCAGKERWTLRCAFVALRNLILLWSLGMGCQSSRSAENKEIKRMVENKVERNSEQKRIKKVVINVKKMDRGPQFH